ncbi:hypothetical protein ALC56_09771, partial [Trachymyrmex septentrionalis]
ILSICISFGVCRGALKADFHNNKGIRRKLKTREDGELIVSQSFEQRFAPNRAEARARAWRRGGKMIRNDRTQTANVVEDVQKEEEEEEGKRSRRNALARASIRRGETEKLLRCDRKSVKRERAARHGLKLNRFAIFRLTFSIKNRHMIGSQSRFRLDTNEKRTDLHLDLIKFIIFFYEEFLFARRQKRSRDAQEMHQMDKSENLKPTLTAKYFLLESLDLSLLLNNRDVLAIRTVEGNACKRTPLEGIPMNRYDMCRLFHLFAGKLSSFLFFFESSNHKSKCKTNGKK